MIIVHNKMPLCLSSKCICIKTIYIFFFSSLLGRTQDQRTMTDTARSLYSYWTVPQQLQGSSLYSYQGQFVGERNLDKIYVFLIVKKKSITMNNVIKELKTKIKAHYGG